MKHSIGVRCATGSSGMSDQRMEMTRGLLEEVENTNQLLYELMFNVYRRNLISHSSFQRFLSTKNALSLLNSLHEFCTTPDLCPLYALFAPSLCPLCALSMPSLRPLCALSAPSLRPLCALSMPSLRPLCALSAPSLRPLYALSITRSTHRRRLRSSARAHPS